MADTLTTNIGLTKPEIGASADSWGSKINSNMDTVDQLFSAGPVLKVVNGGTGASTAANARTNLGLGTISTQSAASVAITGGSITGITDLAVADGGTGSSTAAGARTNLGLGALAVLSAVGTAEIADGSITAAKFASGAVPVEIPSGTRMLFQQTNAPTGWTKDTTHNNKALRVVSGSAGSGGSVTFTDAFANRTGTTDSATATGTVGDTALSIAQLPAHSHGPSSGTAFYANTGIISGVDGGGLFSPSGFGQISSTASVGSGQTHTHTFTGAAHTHGFSLDMAVQYVDLIIATKN